MKKSFKCLVVLFLIAILFTCPITTYASTWECTTNISNSDVTYKEFKYTPPLPISIGQLIGLPNNANQGGFLITAGQKIVVSVRFSTMCRTDFLLVNQITGEFVYSADNYISNAGQMALTVSNTGYYVPLIRQTDSQIPQVPELNSPSGIESYIVYID